MTPPTRRKVHVDYRLPQETIDQIAALMGRTGRSSGDVIATAIDRMYQADSRQNGETKMDRFDSKTMDWQDVLGDGMTAGQVMDAAGTRSDEYQIADWLETQHAELINGNPGFGEPYPHADYLAMALQIVRTSI